MNEQKVVYIHTLEYYVAVKRNEVLDFPGGPVVKTPSFHCKGCRFDPWSGKIPHATWCSQKKIIIIMKY